MTLIMAAHCKIKCSSGFIAETFLSSHLGIRAQKVFSPPSHFLDAQRSLCQKSIPLL